MPTSDWVQPGQLVCAADGAHFVGRIVRVEKGGKVEFVCLRTGDLCSKSYAGFTCRYTPTRWLDRFRLEAKDTVDVALRSPGAMKPGCAVVLGPHGSGKTRLLEAAGGYRLPQDAQSTWSFADTCAPASTETVTCNNTTLAVLSRVRWRLVYRSSETATFWVAYHGESFPLSLADDLRLLFPGLAYLTPDALVFEDGRKRDTRSLSTGEASAIFLAFLLFGKPNAGLILFLDLPEVSHPAWARMLGRWLTRVRDRQVVFTTYSPALLDVLTEAYLDGDLTIVSCFGGQLQNLQEEQEREVRDRLLEGATLGELYQSGEPALGGWPW